MKKIAYIFPVILLIATFILTACSSSTIESDLTSLIEKLNQEISTVGGTVSTTIADSALTLTFPENFTTETIDLVVSQLTTAPDMSTSEALGTAISLEPSGTTFTEPVTFVLDYSDISLPADADETQLKLYYYNEDSSAWDWVSTFNIDTTEKTFTAELDHFSYYQLGLPESAEISTLVTGNATLTYTTGSNYSHTMQGFKFSNETKTSPKGWEAFDAGTFDIGLVGSYLWATPTSSGGMKYKATAPASFAAMTFVNQTGYTAQLSEPTLAAGQYYEVKTVDGTRYAKIKITSYTNTDSVCSVSFQYAYQPADTYLFTKAPVILEKSMTTGYAISVKVADIDGSDDIVMVKWEDAPKTYSGYLYDNGPESAGGNESAGATAGDDIYTHTIGSLATVPITISVYDTVGHVTTTTVSPE
ncbi:hypothetical protein HN928_07655 [bacterium]|jgi:hypothetical protein|nr:hypothetical protein [bacterium]MBT3581481.1 hypothetical protein [bacterium]MBT7088818.1 hypothetical protein [bacterium]